ncbi:MAG TPA: alpha/beta fold hydrolase [Paludibaculum sp.]|jgi:acetyl esterase/lipase
MTIRLALVALLCGGVALAQPALKPGRKYTTVERMAEERLAAVHAARLEFAKQRKTQPWVGVYQDVPAVLHIHAEDAPHTLGRRAEVLAAAKKTGIRVVMFSDHGAAPKAETWTGDREGVLFIAGNENGDKHELGYPSPAPGVRFHSHVEGQMDASPEGWDGMEIYNRHTDAMDDADFLAMLKDATAAPAKMKAIAALFAKYPDEVFGAGCDYWPEMFSRWDKIQQERPFTGVAANDAHQNQVFNGFTLDPYPVAFRNTVTHILAREVSAPAVITSLRAGRAYVSHDWLCDPTGFAFVAVNNLGVFTMGDTAPFVGGTRLTARAPIAAQWKIFRNGAVVMEKRDVQLTYDAKETGVYRAEAWLEVDGEMRPWIYSNAIRVRTPDLMSIGLPSQKLDEGIEAVKDVAYTDGPADDAEKHKLEIYRKAGAAKAPVLFFIHGGAWKSGDRKQYPFFGNRFAMAGYVVVTPSYRLSPKHKHPAHIDDVADALAWTVKNIAAQGGDPSRIFIAGHSAGGHLVALLAANPEHLAKRGLSLKDIRGVLALSGVYDLTTIESGSSSPTFGSDPEVLREASAAKFVRAGLPPFLVTYCEWDYATLPQQAVAFYDALRAAGASAKLVYVPGENHISEMLSIPKPADASAKAMLEFMEGLR